RDKNERLTSMAPPERARELRRAAMQCEADGRYEGADEIFLEAIGLVPNDVFTFERYIMLARNRGDWGRALERCAEMRVRFPREPSGYKLALEAFRETGAFESALRLSNTSRELFAGEPWPTLEEARLLAEVRSDIDGGLRLWRA